MRTRRPTSLARGLYLRVVALVALIALIMGALSLAVADRALDRAADGQLVTAANVLFALMGEELQVRGDAGPSGRTVEVDDTLLSAEDARAFHAYADWRMFAVFDHDRLVLRSDTGPDSRYLPRVAGFSNFAGPRARWRSFGLAVPRYGLLLIIAERIHERHVVLRRILGALALPLLALVASAAVLLWFSLRRGLFRLRRLSEALAARSPQELVAFDEAAWPSDLATLLASLNRLFERLDDAFGREQRLTDEAAHQLRTPLAAIKIRAQSLVGPEPVSAEARALVDAIDRAILLADRMLLAARLGSTAVRRRMVDAREIAVSVVTELAASAAGNDVEFSLEQARSMSVTTDPELLAIALTAICENAVKHAPPGSLVELTVTSDPGGGVRLVVVDQGGGIPEADRERVLLPFVRLDFEQPGSGLGLSIAARAVELLGGTLTLGPGPDGTGLAAIILLPPDL